MPLSCRATRSCTTCSAPSEVRDLLGERWGDRAVAVGAVDRGAVAQIVFADPQELAWLEGTIFPLVGELIAAWRAQLEEEGKVDVAVVEVPLLFEAGIEGLFDATIAVVADERLRAERAGGRGHQGVEGREGRQLTQEDKAARADHLVRNDGTLDELQTQMSTVLEQIKARAAGERAGRRWAPGAPPVVPRRGRRAGATGAAPAGAAAGDRLRRGAASHW